MVDIIIIIGFHDFVTKWVNIRITFLNYVLLIDVYSVFIIGIWLNNWKALEEQISKMTANHNWVKSGLLNMQCGI